MITVNMQKLVWSFCVFFYSCFVSRFICSFTF